VWPDVESEGSGLYFETFLIMEKGEAKFTLIVGLQLCFSFPDCPITKWFHSGNSVLFNLKEFWNCMLVKVISLKYL
jgi:hypothetical protein